MTEREQAIMTHIASARNGICSADWLAFKLSYRPARSGRLAVSSTLRSLERRRLVTRIPPADQWDHADYALTPAGRTALGEQP